MTTYYKYFFSSVLLKGIIGDHDLEEIKKPDSYTAVLGDCPSSEILLDSYTDLDSCAAMCSNNDQCSFFTFQYNGDGK